MDAMRAHQGSRPARFPATSSEGFLPWLSALVAFAAEFPLIGPTRFPGMGTP